MGGFAYLALLAALWPRRRKTQRAPLPDNVREEDYVLALQRLNGAANRLRAFTREAPATDEPLFLRLAELLDTIRAHHEANPAHVTLTRNFVRHTLGHMIGSISDYVELAERSGVEHRDRLAEISRGFEAYVPALERIDRACLDNDLTALEVSVEVLNTQIRR